MPAPIVPPPANDVGALPFPRRLQRWLDVWPVTKLDRIQTYITLPAFNINVNWQGYSDIVGAFNVEGPNNFSFAYLSNIPLNPNYMLCVMWKDSSNKTYRYAMWRNVGEVVFFDIPLYTGQKIGKNFRFEIWSTNTATVSQTTSINFYTSVLGGFDYRWSGNVSLVTPDALVTNFNASLIANPAGIMDITACGEPTVIKTFYAAGIYQNRPFYLPLGAPIVADPSLYNGVNIRNSVTDQWYVMVDVAVFPPKFYYGNTVGLASPDLETSWTAVTAALPAPTIAALPSGTLPLIFPANSTPQSN